MAGAAAATRHLIQAHGHRRIAALRGPAATSTGRERRTGYEAALREAGVTVDPALVAHCPYTLEAGREVARRLLTGTPRPAALLAAGSVLTAGALLAMAELGLAVPDDVALVGFGPAPRSALERPDLTMVGIPGEAMGERAGRLLLQRLDQSHAGGASTASATMAAVAAGAPLRERLPVELLIGRSCGCPA